MQGVSVTLPTHQVLVWCHRWGIDIVLLFTTIFDMLVNSLIYPLTKCINFIKLFLCLHINIVHVDSLSKCLKPKFGFTIVQNFRKKASGKYFHNCCNILTSVSNIFMHLCSRYNLKIHQDTFTYVTIRSRLFSCILLIHFRKSEPQNPDVMYT